MAERVLTERALRAALLARQLLLRRARLGIPAALERMCGLQDQYAPSGYVGLWSRIEGLARDDLTRALARRSVVQATLMRATIHLVSRRDFWPFAEAVGDPLRSWWFRTTKRGAERRRLASIDRRARDALATGPMRRKELLEQLGIDADGWSAVGLYTPLVRVPPSGTWEHRRADHLAVAEDWIGPSTSNPVDGASHLVRRYLSAFGPATRADVMSFTGLPGATADQVLATIRIRRFRGEDDTKLLDVPGARIPDPAEPAPVRFLPHWDATLLIHARRTQILPERFRTAIFHTKAPHSFATFMVNGQVAGTWRYEGGRIATAPFEPMPRGARRAVDDEAGRLAAFHA
jgi:hypothetical protein